MNGDIWTWSKRRVLAGGETGLQHGHEAPSPKSGGLWRVQDWAGTAALDF